TLAVAAAAATYVAHRRAMAGRIILAAFLLVYAIIPVFGQVSNYPFLHTPELRAVSDWARTSTPKSSVFLFPDNGKQNYAGLFRSEALRAVYVDWKSGGQVNYLKEFGEEWWSRWKKTMDEPFDREHPDRYRSLGIDYI